MRKIIQDSEINYDEFGRANGVLLVNKETGETSHDVVDKVRKIYGTRKVGHAGTLDPFAEGLLILLVGKATKLSDQLLGLDKVYEADILLGLSTDTSDIEGEVIAKSEVTVEKEEIEKAVKSFLPGYEQFVPIFSSVKVQGNKLRVLARESDSFEVDKEGNAKFIKNGKEKEIKIPSKQVNIYEFKILSLEKVKSSDFFSAKNYGKTKSQFSENLINEIEGSERIFQLLKVSVECSKGTYIRQLAKDLGEKLNTGAMLVGLKRTQIGEWDLEKASLIKELEDSIISQ